MFYLGIDPHAKQLTINLRDEEGNAVLKRQVSTRPEKILEFFEQLTARCAECGCGFWAIVKVCGFNEWLRNFRCDRIVLVQPEDSSRRKTDKRDAAKLSEMLWMYRYRIASSQPINNLKIVNIPSSLQQQQRRLTNLRKDTKAAHTKSINRIKHVLRRHNLQHEMPTKTFPAKAATAWLKTIQLPPADMLELKLATEDIEMLRKRVDELDAMITSLSINGEDAQLIMKTTGFGLFSAVAISSRIAGIERFKRPRSLAN